MVPPVVRSALAGVVGAMAMTGVRRVTTGLGLVPKPPPEEILDDALRDEAIELAHWGFGAACGAAFALVPARARTHPAGGPVYGLSVWAGFELVVAPVLGLRKPTQRTARERTAIMADHVLYGLVLATAARSDGAA